MAKYERVPTLSEMETILGYSVEQHQAHHPYPYFYSDFRPVAPDVESMTLREYEEMHRVKQNGCQASMEHDLQIGTDYNVGTQGCTIMESC
jgi:hypothetical protein